MVLDSKGLPYFFHLFLVLHKYSKFFSELFFNFIYTFFMEEIPTKFFEDPLKLN